MNFRRSRNGRHVTYRDPPRRCCGPDRPLTHPVVEGRSGSFSTRSKIHAANHRTSFVQLGKQRIAEFIAPAPALLFVLHVRHDTVFTANGNRKNCTIFLLRGPRRSTNPCAKLLAPRTYPMKRFLLVIVVCAVSLFELDAAVVNGKVMFLTKRGQKP